MNRQTRRGKLLMIIVLMIAMSGCHALNPQDTASARAAYGDTVPSFDAHTKKNQKRKKQARREAKQAKRDVELWRGWPY